MTPSPAAFTVCPTAATTSVPVCSHTPDAHARSGVPLQYRHSLPKPRQCGCQVGSGYWKTSAGFGFSCGGAGTAAAGAATEPVGTTKTSCNALNKSAAVARPIRPVSPRRAARAPTGRRSGDVDDYVLDLGVEVQRIGAQLPSPTALLVAAPGRDRVDHVVAVDVDGPGLESMGHAVSAPDVPRPHSRDQPVDRAVRFGDEVVLVAERDRRHHRPEDLLARDPHLAVDVGEDSRLDEIATLESLRLVAPDHQPRALLSPRADVAQHALHLRLGHQRAHLVYRVDA